tara:strand:+ start:2969 stop:3637 length:669 start_codon:yes stop_codon:yes gene_type:complete
MNADQAVVLYGSVARGDDDEASDIDILVVSSNGLPVDDHAFSSLAQGRPINISCYTWSEFEAMSASGSLFIKHLLYEAKPIAYVGNGEKVYLRILNDVTEYRHVERDLASFRLGIEDCRHGISVGSPGEFELAVVGGIARHASVLGCYLKGETTFGRTSIARACRLLGLEGVSEELALAHRFRLFEQRQCLRPKSMDRGEVMSVINACDKFICALEGFWNAK